MVVITQVGNGMKTLFWTYRWLHGQSLYRIVPYLFGIISSRARKRSVHEAITEMRWISDIRGALTIDVLAEYLALEDLISDVVLQSEIEDNHICQFSASGKYSTK